MAHGPAQPNTDQFIENKGQRIEIARLNNLLEQAWGIIANAGGGNWEKSQTKEWIDAAIRFRTAYFGDTTLKQNMLCCSGLGSFGKCGRGTKKGCNGVHCRCMEKDCPNMHYIDCHKHYIHVEHPVK